MRILLVLPRDHLYRYRGIANRLIGPYAPLAVVTLSASVPKELDAHIEILHEGIQRPDHEKKSYDLVGTTCVTSSLNRACELSDYWRSQ